MNRRFVVMGSAWLFAVLMAIVVAGTSWHAVWIDFGDFDDHFIEKFRALRPVLHIHGTMAGLALLLGPWQFLEPLRRRSAMLHRCIGGVYVLCVIPSAILGFKAGLHAAGGLAPKVSFCLLSVLWLWTLWMAWRQPHQHGEWLLRNYALTFSAVTLRNLMYGLKGLGYDFYEVYALAAWASWSINLAAVEGWMYYNRIKAATRRLEAV